MQTTPNTVPTLIEVQEIAKILPTGFYLGERIDFEVVEGLPASYFDPMQFIIKISYDQIAPYLNPNSIEDDIRCLLYHEVSHAMLTPRDGVQNVDYGLFSTALRADYTVWYSKRQSDYKQKNGVTNDVAYNEITKQYWNPLKQYWRDMVNIFEDQRIETINKDVFMRVDFPSFVKKINDYDSIQGTPPQNVQELFYHVVRFNDLEPDLVKKAYQIIYKFYTVNAVQTNAVPRYCAAMFDLACDCLDRFNQKYANMANQIQQAMNALQQQGQGKPQEGEQAEGNQGNQQQGDKQNGQSQNQSGENSEQENSVDNTTMQVGGTPTHNQDQSHDNNHTGNMTIEQMQQALDTMSEEELEQLKDEVLNELSKQTGMSPEEIMAQMRAQAIKEVLGQFDCAKGFNQSAERIILRMLRRKSIEAKSVAGYSGRINPKNIHKPGRVENYRWFDKANPNGINATAGKFRINFFCDNSGSYFPNLNTTNSIIRCMYNLARKYPAFDFDLVTNGNFPVLRTKANMGIECNEGTYLPDSIFGIYNRLQKPGQTTWNIVLFDGGLIGPKEDFKNYGVFNHHNVIMICDKDDQQHIEKYCPNAHKIFTNKYLVELEDNLVRCMDQMFR